LTDISTGRFAEILGRMLEIGFFSQETIDLAKRKSTCRFAEKWRKGIFKPGIVGLVKLLSRMNLRNSGRLPQRKFDLAQQSVSFMLIVFRLIQLVACDTQSDQQVIR